MAEIQHSTLTGADLHSPAAHKTSHQSGGSDEILLDNLGTPADNTDLNATTTYHGLLPKLDNDADHYMNGQGAWSTPAGGGAGLPVVDTTNIVKGSADATKLMRFEVDGITTATTRVMTVPDKDITLCDTAEVMLLSGGTMAGNLNMGGYLLDDVDDIQADTTLGIDVSNSVGSLQITLADSLHSFVADAHASMGGIYQIQDMADPTAAQHASTKNYDDAHILTKEAVTSFTDGYILVYHTASGKFEMEIAGGSAGLPAVDTTSIVKGSADATKLMRFEVDGLTTATTRVMTVPDKDITLCDTAEVMLLSGAQTMAGNMNLGGYHITSCPKIASNNATGYLYLHGSNDHGAALILYGEDNATYPGDARMFVPNAAKDNWVAGLIVDGVSDAPIVTIPYGLDMNDTDISAVKSILGYSDSAYIYLRGGINTYSPAIYMYGKDHASYAGHFRFLTPNAAGNNLLTAIEIHGKSDTPLVEIGYGLDMNATDIDDIGALTLNDATELTMSSAGIVTATQSYHSIDTYGDAASDDLEYIMGAGAGEVLIIQANNSARTVVAKHGTGNLLLDAAADKTLDNANDTLTLLYDGTNWVQIGFSNNGA